MAYTRVNWVDGTTSHDTPISAENLNNMDAGIKALDTAMDDKADISGEDFTGDISVNFTGDSSKPFIKTDYANGAVKINSKNGYSTDYKIAKIVRTATSNTYEYNYPAKSGVFVTTDDDGNTDLGTNNTIESGVLRSVAEGYNNTIDDNWTEECHVEGFNNVGSGTASHAEGSNNGVTESDSHVEGRGNTVSAEMAHAEGYNNTVSALYGHAEGGANTASGVAAHAEGSNVVASGAQAHAEGGGTQATAYASHAEGGGTQATADCSHAQNRNTVAGYDSQTAMGKYNDNKSTNLLEVGNGESGSPSNAMEVTSDGDVLIKNGGVSLYGLDENKEVLGAKNLLQLKTFSSTQSGVTIVCDASGATLNGTATGTYGFIVTDEFTLPAGNYILSGCPSGGGYQAYQMEISKKPSGGSFAQLGLDTGNGFSFSASATDTFRVAVYVYSQYGEYSNFKYYPMIRLATDPNSTYRPYAMGNQELTQRLLALEARVN